MKNKRGITLISLVITILVLVILSAVAIYLALGNNGILNKAEQAKNETIKQTATEKINLKITNMQIEIYSEEQRMPTLQEFADGLCEDDEIQYVQLQSKKVGSLNKIEVGEAESIFTKLKEYPYEFEINSSLQLASIDGVQVATNNNNQTSNGVICSLINKEDGIYNKDEGGYIFSTPTNQIIITSNNIITLIESIKNYDYIQFELKIYFDSIGQYAFPVTKMISTSQIKNNYNNTDIQDLAKSFMIVHSTGDAFNRVICCLKDDKTIKVESGYSNYPGYSKMQITDIKGIIK